MILAESFDTSLGTYVYRHNDKNYVWYRYIYGCGISFGDTARRGSFYLKLLVDRSQNNLKRLGFFSTYLVEQLSQYRGTFVKNINGRQLEIKRRVVVVVILVANAPSEKNPHSLPPAGTCACAPIETVHVRSLRRSYI